jgi:DNA-binding MarR family transcriptional regulator
MRWHRRAACVVDETVPAGPMRDAQDNVRGDAKVTLDRRRIEDLDQLIEAWAAMRPHADPLDFSIILYIEHIARVWANLYGAIAARYDLSGADVRLLVAVARDKGRAPVRATDLGYRVMLSPAAVTYRLDRLVAADLVTRTTDVSDRRAYLIRLTAKGERTFDRVVSETSELRARNLAVFDDTPGAKEQLVDRLRVMAREWEREALGRAEPAMPADPVR